MHILFTHEFLTRNWFRPHTYTLRTKILKRWRYVWWYQWSNIHGWIFYLHFAEFLNKIIWPNKYSKCYGYGFIKILLYDLLQQLNALIMISKTLQTHLLQKQSEWYSIFCAKLGSFNHHNNMFNYLYELI